MISLYFFAIPILGLLGLIIYGAISRKPKPHAHFNSDKVETEPQETQEVIKPKCDSSVSRYSKAGDGGQRLSQSGKPLTSKQDFAWHRVPNEFVIFDLETTGLPHRDPVDIVEISAIRINKEAYLQNNHLDTFTTLVKPWRGGLDPQATAVNQITQEMIDQEAVDASTALHQFLEFVGSNLLVAYNVKFDRWFLEREMNDHGISKRFKYECAYKLAKNAFPRLSNYKLTSVASHLGIPTAGAHRALNDCAMAMEVYLWGVTSIENSKPTESYKIDRHNIKYDEALANKRIIFVGTLPNFTHDEAAVLASQAGMKVDDAILEKVDIVVAGKNAGKKLLQAQSLNKQILSEDQFLLMINSVIAKPRANSLSY